MRYIAILGRQPEFGFAELDSLLGDESVSAISRDIAAITVTQPPHYSRYGSVLKFALDSPLRVQTNSSNLDIELANLIAEQRPYQVGAKLKIGISDYSRTISAQRLQKIGLSLKKILKSNGYSIRIIPNKSATLNSAQVLHNSLTGESGIELVLYPNGRELGVAITQYEQDIEAYAARDQARPMRDARVGMLPPKLAQTILNLATGQQTTPSTSTVVLDPFCGTGVVLQEALLMGYSVYGTDLESRMIDYSEHNLRWIQSQRSESGEGHVLLEVGDAASHTWNQFSTIAAETYLGRPLTSIPDAATFTELVQSVNTLHKKVFQNIARQLPSGARLCLAVPAWQTKKGVVSLPILDQLRNMGYNQLVFSHVKAKHLVYARADQIVARQLVVLQKQ